MGEMDRQHIIRHPYGNCNKNLTINELYHAGIPYYPIFAYSFGFSFDPGRDSLLGNAISTYYEPLSYAYEIDPIYQVYGIETYIEDKDEDKDAFLKKLCRLLEISNVACQMDAYYDPSTAYNGLYQTTHTKGHGRIITAMDEDFVYYYTTHKDDPVSRFGISRDDMHLACECLVRFRYPKVLNDRAMRQAVLQKILYQWFVDVDYRKMFDDLVCFSEAIRDCRTLSDEIDHQFAPGIVPNSRLFRNLNIIRCSRGATATFLQGYMNEFGNEKYQGPAELMKRSLELWRMEKALLVKYGLTGRASIQEAMADYLVEICDVEKKFILMLKDVISVEVSREKKQHQ